MFVENAKLNAFQRAEIGNREIGKLRKPSPAGSFVTQALLDHRTGRKQRP